MGGYLVVLGLLLPCSRIPEDALLQINFENLPVEVLEEVEELLFVFLRSMTLLHIVKWVMEVSCVCVCVGVCVCVCVCVCVYVCVCCTYDSVTSYPTLCTV